MKFDQFLKNSSKIKNIPLPGREHQFKMSPPFREQLLKEYEEEMKHARKAGVMALFYPDHNALSKLVLILRKTYRGVHSAQVGFPGGKYEKSDADLKMTALRETEEEIGINKSKIEVLKPMTELYIPPSNFMVFPFIGISDSPLKFTKQDDEVEDIIEADVADLLDDTNISRFNVMTSLGKKIEVPAYLLSGQIVWGATAMMLSEIKELIKTVKRL